MPSKKRLAFYIRLSVEDGDLKTSDSKTESNSVGNQRKLLIDYYQSHEALLEAYDTVEFCDDGYSGTNFNRPRFQDMMDLVKERQIDCIMVKDLSRFGREYLEVGAYLELILPLFGTRFISVNEGFDSSNYIGTTGGLELALRNLINGLYSKDLSIKVRSAIKTRNRRGDYCGSGGFYGYLVDPENKRHLIVDEEVRPVVEEIFALCINGLTTAQIAVRLNEERIPPPVVRKKQLGNTYNGRRMDDDPLWIPATVRRILNDERYTGKMISGKVESAGIRTNKMKPIPKEEWIVVPGTHEAIVSDETFEAAHLSMQSRIKTINKNTSGNRKNNLFICGFCGRKLQKSQGSITHLFCMKARSDPNSDCAGIHEDMEKLKENVLRAVQHYSALLLERQTVELAKRQEEAPATERQIKKLRSQIAQLKNRKYELYEEYRTEKLTKEQFLKAQKDNEAKVNLFSDRLLQCEDALTQLQAQKNQLRPIRESHSQIEQLTSYDPAVIGKLVERIRVYPGDRIEIEWKCKDVLSEVTIPAQPTSNVS